MAEARRELESLIDSLIDGVPTPITGEHVLDAGLDPKLLAAYRAVAALAQVQRSLDADGFRHESDTVAPAVPSSPPPLGVPLGAQGLLGAIADDDQRWGNFVLLRRIGGGSFGEVYLARDLWLDHLVALKLLRPEFSRRTLLDEARRMVQVRHANVVSVHGAGVHDGRMAFWMDHVDGSTLLEGLEQQGLMGDAEAALCGVQICGALAAVHAAGMVHRDVKAQNVMRRREDGRFLLMDFGAGEYLGTMPPGGRLQGTPLYLAPELLRGEPATVVSDIYALGVLLFHLVSGRFPVEAPSLDELKAAHAQTRRLRLEELQPGLSEAFVEVVDRMLAADPNQRFPSAVAARAALQAAIAGSPTERTVPAAVKWVASVGAVIGFILAMGATASGGFNIVFGRTGEFAREPLRETFVLGLRALLAPAIFTALAIALALLLGGVAKVACHLVKPLGRVVTRVRAAMWVRIAQHRLDDPVMLAQLLILFGVVSLAGLLVLSGERLLALTESVSDAPTSALAAIRRAYGADFFIRARALELFLVAYGAFGSTVVSSARRRAKRLSPAVWTGILALPLVAVLLLRGYPYRVLYQDQFERVDFGDTRCYETGARAETVLLYCPGVEPPRNRVVPRGSPDLHRRGVFERIFRQGESE